MDEKGFLLGYNNRVKVIVRHRRRTPMETQDRSREWITVVVCASAGQFMLPPMIIYKGICIYHGWTSTVDDADTLFVHSNKGFITDSLAMDWLHHFDSDSHWQPFLHQLLGHLSFLRLLGTGGNFVNKPWRQFVHLRVGIKSLLFSYCERWHTRLMLLGHGQSWQILRMRISRFAMRSEEHTSELQSRP